MFVGKRMDELCILKGISLRELAERSGISVVVLSRIKNSKNNGTLGAHMKITQALGVDLVELYKDPANKAVKRERH